MSLTNPNHAVTAQRLSEFYQGILPYLNGPEPEPSIVYGMRILNNESVPSAKIEYLEDAVGMTPSAMNFSTGIFDYGDWGDAFFMPKPCMLKYDGTVDYYLDPNDYSKKEDGTASDVADISYGGNAMMEWPKIWLKIVPDATKDNKQADIFISNAKIDNDYTDWNYHNSLGNSVEHFYTPIYNGSLIDGKLRSISGQQANNGKTGQQEYDYALANNPSGSLIWTTETFVDLNLITILLVLISKSTNVQDTFGKGLSSGGSSSINNSFRTGIHDARGLFYGTNSDTTSTTTFTNAVKVFGMENVWGFQNRRFVGNIVSNGLHKVKLTYGTEDGSTVTGYNLNGNGYIESVTGTLTDHTYVKELYFSSDGYFVPFINSGASDTTYYSDAIYYYNIAAGMPLSAGYSKFGNANGIFYRMLRYNSTEAAWDFNACISARPLS